MTTLSEVFDPGGSFAGPALDDDTLRRAEEILGVHLPLSYVELLFQQNGGVLRRRCCPTDFGTSWAPRHFEIHALLGIGGKWGIDPASQLGGSAYLIAEWGYPDIGIVIGLMPSGGHDTLMLDYSESGPMGEPSVAYVDEDRIPRRVANSFGEFLALLVDCNSLDASGE